MKTIMKLNPNVLKRHAGLCLMAILFTNCVAVSTVTDVDRASENVRLEDQKELIISKDRFYQVLNSETELTESHFQIPQYGTLKAGKQIASSGNFSNVEIINNFMFIPIRHGGGYPISDRSICNLIWDSEYRVNAKGEMEVDLIISFNNSDARRAMVTRTVRFDLTSLRHVDVNSISINLKGYNKSLKYKY
ncbi:hypothetical protein [Fulvivirga lutimaris]|uniref:hypothetical protein n=1 Tax=Fulvivirga lutimaris TaxID=1819566 RepID=UPI0012BC4A7B|nr:hypothetical protein [Fulvivirga lutimaris]MTI41033.1 hypothetical protein [Fulvivirga lutimaris]